MLQLSRQSALVILPFFLWGTAMVVMKAVIPNTAPLFLAAFRLIPAGILLLGFAIFLGRSQPKGWEAWLWIILFALVDGTLFQGFLAFGLTRTGAGLGSLLIDSQPFAVAVLASFFFGEFISAKMIAGLLIGVLGIGLIGLPAELWQQLGSNHLDGSLFANLITVLQGGVFGG
jgi:drug/metabolite transporter (DMT)-like permease